MPVDRRFATVSKPVLATPPKIPMKEPPGEGMAAVPRASAMTLRVPRKVATRGCRRRRKRPGPVRRSGMSSKERTREQIPPRPKASRKAPGSDRARTSTVRPVSLAVAHRPVTSRAWRHCHPRPPHPGLGTGRGGSAGAASDVSACGWGLALGSAQAAPAPLP